LSGDDGGCGGGAAGGAGGDEVDGDEPLADDAAVATLPATKPTLKLHKKTTALNCRANSNTAFVFAKCLLLLMHLLLLLLLPLSFGLWCVKKLVLNKLQSKLKFPISHSMIVCCSSSFSSLCRQLLAACGRA